MIFRFSLGLRRGLSSESQAEVASRFSHFGFAGFEVPVLPEPDEDSEGRSSNMSEVTVVADRSNPEAVV